jgi:heparan-alpha-glucosaminide N-acetyltransferase
MAATITAERRRATPEVVHGEKAAPPGPPPRLVSLDAYRGFIMLVMASSGLGFVAMHRKFPASEWWSFLGYQFDHVAWTGCAFWDLIQPSFMFMVGVAAPYSFASRVSKGDSYGRMLFHAVWRALLLILLAVFLSSPLRLSKEMQGYLGPTTNWVFVNVLAQIGMGYVIVFLLVGKGWRVQLGVIAAILIGYTLFFGLYPLPGSDFDYEAVGVAADWPHHMTGWFAHWNKNSNAAHFFDVWFLNLFPRPEPFKFNEGGYQTLNFIPSLATMLLGLMAGEMLRSERKPAQKFLLLVAAAVACLGIGWLMGEFVCPIVKRIWTPSWAVYSTGWTFVILAAFFGVIDVVGLKRWSWPLVVVGMNSIAMYCMAQLMKGWIGRNLHTWFGKGLFGSEYGPVIDSASILFVLWLFCLWLYRRKVFLRI